VCVIFRSSTYYTDVRLSCHNKRILLLLLLLLLLGWLASCGRGFDCRSGAWIMTPCVTACMQGMQCMHVTPSASWSHLTPTCLCH